MKTIQRMVWLCLSCLCLVSTLLFTPMSHAQGCVGKFPNPITDYCWSCILPITLGSFKIATNGQEDTPNPSNPLCFCPGTPPKFGLSIGFWEPARTVEATLKPYCLISLGGVDLDPGIDAQKGMVQRASDSKIPHAFYQVHYYINPLLFWLEVLSDFPCLEQKSLDVAYLSELDPTWADDELSAILSPEVLLFLNPVAMAACTADCIAASTIGFGLPELFWCAGCQGMLLPLNGNVAGHVSGVNSAALLVQRMTAKLHRQGMAWGYSGKDGLCGPYLKPVMDKTDYKMQLTYPIPVTEKVNPYSNGSNAIIQGKCCIPFGRNTSFYGAGKEFAIKGEDFAFMLFRKRNCCMSPY
jgi:conjugal transfer pilus assembly protein TraU